MPSERPDLDRSDPFGVDVEGNAGLGAELDARGLAGLRHLSRAFRTRPHVIRIGRPAARKTPWCVGVLAVWPAVAAAHHVPGGGASEGLRSLNGLGGGPPRALTRLTLLEELSRESTTTLNPSVSSTTSLLAEVAPRPWFSLGIQAPLLVVDEDAVEGPPKVGYGDTRVTFRLTPHAAKLRHRVLTFGVTASFPTRTVQYESDPGRTWSVSPSVLFTRAYDRTFWQVLGVASVETRPAGTALEVSAALSGGVALHSRVTVGLGVLVDVRVLTFCARSGGATEVCREGRSTELDRPMGATRITQLASLTVRASEHISLYLGLQGPLSRRRDVDLGGTFSVQAFF